jgi:hypothetical protein
LAVGDPKARLESGILFVLSYVVWGSLEDRHLIAELKSVVTSMNVPNRTLRFSEPPIEEIRRQIKQSGEICVSGVSLFRFIPMFFDPNITDALDDNANLKLILADPDSAAPGMASFRSEHGVTAEIEKDRILGVLKYLMHHMSQHPEQKIEIRTCPYLPPYSIRIITSRDQLTKPYVHARLLPFRSPSLFGPFILPDANADAESVQFFAAQFQHLWDASKKIDPIDPRWAPAEKRAEPNAEKERRSDEQSPKPHPN